MSTTPPTIEETPEQLYNTADVMADWKTYAVPRKLPVLPSTIVQNLVNHLNNLPPWPSNKKAPAYIAVPVLFNGKTYPVFFKRK